MELDHQSEVEKEVVEATREGWGLIGGSRSGEGRGGHGGRRRRRKNWEGKGKNEGEAASKISNFQKYP